MALPAFRFLAAGRFTQRTPDDPLRPRGRCHAPTCRPIPPATPPAVAGWLGLSSVSSSCCRPGPGSPDRRGLRQRPPADPLLPILTDELRRNVDGLKREATPPYFASYTVYDVQSAYVRASFGALVGRHQNRSRSAVVDVRVGDYALDNTREIRGDMMAGFRGFSRTALPLPGPQGEPADAVRAVLWRATDRKFKQAIERFTQVKTNVAAKVQDGVDVADLSREPPQTFSEPARPAPADVAPWEGRLRRISAPFGEQPLVLTSDATLTSRRTRRYFVSTEGSQIVTGDTTARLMISATTKADDGMELPLYRSYFARTPDGLPAEAQLVADVREMVGLLGRCDRRRSSIRTRARRSCRAAPPACSSTRSSATASKATAKQADDAQTFAKRLNQPVLPAFLSVVFDPTIERDGNTELIGHYAYDDEGVKARRVVAVDQRRAEDVPAEPLAGRRHRRSRTATAARMPGLAPVSRQSNLVVDASETVPFDELVARLKREIRAAGQAVRPVLREHRRRLHLHRPHDPERVQRAAERRLPHLSRTIGRWSWCAASI